MTTYNNSIQRLLDLVRFLSITNWLPQSEYPCPR